MNHTDPAPPWPVVRPLGLDGYLISFADQLSEPANRAALAFRAAIDQALWPWVRETSISLASAYLRFDLDAVEPSEVEAHLAARLATRDWYAAPLPGGRRLWRIPTVFGTELAPQLDEAAALAGMRPEAAIASLSAAPMRVQTIGFAPGQPYLGQLPQAWDIPRQTALTAQVPVGALTVAIRQFVLFAVAAPTGWRHVGQTNFRAYQPDHDTPFRLNLGDEVIFEPVSRDALEALQDAPDGGAVPEPLA